MADGNASASSSPSSAAGRTSGNGAAATINPEMVSDMKLQARSMLYKEAVNVLGAVEARVYYDSLRSPGAPTRETHSGMHHLGDDPAAIGSGIGTQRELYARIEESLIEVAKSHPVPPPRKALVHVSKLILSSGSVRDAFEPLIAWLVAYAAELQ